MFFCSLNRSTSPPQWCSITPAVQFPQHGATLWPWLDISGHLMSLNVKKQKEPAVLTVQITEGAYLPHHTREEGFAFLGLCLLHVPHLTGIGLFVNNKQVRHYYNHFLKQLVLFRWKFKDPLAKEEESDFPTGLVKIVWCQGVIYRWECYLLEKPKV